MALTPVNAYVYKVQATAIHHILLTFFVWLWVKFFCLWDSVSFLSWKNEWMDLSNSWTWLWLQEFQESHVTKSAFWSRIETRWDNGSLALGATIMKKGCLCLLTWANPKVLHCFWFPSRDGGSGVLLIFHPFCLISLLCHSFHNPCSNFCSLYLALHLILTSSLQQAPQWGQSIKYFKSPSL